MVVIDECCLDEPLALVYSWSYHPGDDLAWADPEFDDSGWQLTMPSLREVDKAPEGWSGIGWFRRRLRVVEAFGDTVGIHMAQAGASEIFLDGRLVASFGKVSNDPEEEETLYPQYVASVKITPGVEHVLAVRYSNVTGNVFRRNFRGFEMRIGRMQALTAYGIRLIRRYTAFMAVLAGVFGAFTLLHLLLFAFRPAATENLYFAIFAGSILGMTLAEMRMDSVSELGRMLFFYKWSLTGAFAMALSALLLEIKVFKHRLGVVFYLLVVAAAGALVWVWTRPAFGGVMPAVIVLAAIYLATLWQAVLALIDREPEAWVIGLGFLILTVSFLTMIVSSIGWIEVSQAWPAVIGLGGLTLCFSVYLTRRVARTNRELEAQLAQIQELTARTIEQERRAAQEETERRVLEADNARKTAELEEARQLQLAMLPVELPRLDRFEVAVHMSTANEVGGDYYDFHANGDGSCTLAVGDATGHGLHAGMVVGAAKSLFQTCSQEAELATVLQRIGDGLSSMHRRQASMAMMLIRLREHHLEIASAGMPPALVWRHENGSIEELLVPSVPLGTLSRTQFAETEVDLRPGDSMLLMTDGLAEVANPAGELLGYERARRFFAQAASEDPAAAIRRLLSLAAEFHAGTPLQDDMTLVVLKAR